MPRLVSSEAVDSIRFAADTLNGAANYMSSGDAGHNEKYDEAVRYVLSLWPGASARDLAITFIALEFTHAVLSGRVQRLSRKEFTVSLLVSIGENLEANGFGGE